MSKQRAQAWQWVNGALQQGAPEDFLPLWAAEKPVISLVGGGGKTTLLYYLAGCFALRGKRAAVLTTTRMGAPAQPCLEMAACRRQWQQGAFAVCGKMENGKFRAPEAAFLDEILMEADAVLIEADGSRRLPCKAPAEHEPVLLPQTTHVIVVMGLDALEGAMAETCLRIDKVQAILGCGAEHHLTAEDLAALLLSPQGSRKGVENRAFYAVLNKCDTPARLAAGQQVLQALADQGFHGGILTCGMRRSETFEKPGEKRE